MTPPTPERRDRLRTFAPPHGLAALVGGGARRLRDWRRATRIHLCTHRRTEGRVLYQGVSAGPGLIPLVHFTYHEHCRRCGKEQVTELAMPWDEHREIASDVFEPGPWPIDPESGRPLGLAGRCDQEEEVP